MKPLDDAELKWRPTVSRSLCGAAGRRAVSRRSGCRLSRRDAHRFKFSRFVKELIRGTQEHPLLAVGTGNFSQPTRVVRIEA
jgi:hypothetical protein